MTLLAVILILLSTVNGSGALDIRQCNRPLGMESGRILDSQISASSSFDNQSTGPQNARLRSENGSGAWCPLHQINESSHEWLQVEFAQDMVISAVETQGRFDKGRGMEFPTGYMLEYWRTSLGRWARYKDRTGNEIIAGNSDTQSAVLRVLDGAIIAKLIRLIPVSEVTRTVCLRVEVHGCSYVDSLTSYSAPAGSQIDGLDFRDLSYDGDERDNGRLFHGLGRLFDGVLGADNFEATPSGWLGWRKDVHGDTVVLEFNFGSRRNFTALSLHTNNYRKLGAGLFAEARVFFSTSDDDLYSQRIVKFEQQPDEAFENARWVRIGINTRLARRVRLELTMAVSSEWLLLSEVRFESNNVAFRLPEGLEDDDSTLLSIDGPGSIGIIAKESSNGHNLETILYILLPFTLAALILLALACYLLLPRPTDPFKLLQKQTGVLPEFYDHQCCGTSSRSSASRRYAPTPEKLSLEDGEYADPDAEQTLLQKSPPAMKTSVYAASDLFRSQYSAATTYCPTMYSTLPNDEMYQPPAGAVDDYAPIEIPRDSLERVQSLGDGQFGSIELCRLDGTLVAVKSLKASPDSSAESDFLREIHVMSQLKHQNIVRVLGVASRQRPILCVTEFMPQGDLRQFLGKRPHTSTEFLLSLGTQVAAGCAYLESRKFVHRDLAARNCLVDDNGTVKIADFGMARSLYASDYYRLDGQFALPIRWMAAESIFEGRFSHKSDSWALAVTLWELFNGCREKPFARLSDTEVIENLRTLLETSALKEQLARPGLCPPSIYDLLTKCWRARDAERPSLTDVHRFLQSAQFKIAGGPPPPPNRAAPVPPV